jgi:CSLREA domain-containing protein
MKRAGLAAMSILIAQISLAATFTVTKNTDDPVDGCDADCSLREAVIAANQTIEHDTVVVPAGTYVLSLTGAGEDSAATGDLDLLEDVTIIGDPLGGTVIDGNLSDRLVHLNGATVVLIDLTMTRGRTIGDWFGAGGILVESGTLTATGCVLSSCDCDAHGGGLFSLGVVILERCAIIGNTGAHGGGIYHAGDDLFVENSTVSGNTATTNFAGGISVDGLAMAATIRSSTITGNSGVEADGMALRTSLTVANTIFDDSCAVIPGMGLVTSEGGNLESPFDTCGLNHADDIVGVTAVDLDLGPLQNNGGITPTHALLTGSVAVDSGNDMLCPATDQRDWPRSDGSCDIGSFEAGADEPTVFADDFESGDTSAWTAVVPQSDAQPAGAFVVESFPG